MSTKLFLAKVVASSLFNVFSVKAGLFEAELLKVVLGKLVALEAASDLWKDCFEAADLEAVLKSSLGRTCRS